MRWGVLGAIALLACGCWTTRRPAGPEPADRPDVDEPERTVTRPPSPPTEPTDAEDVVKSVDEDVDVVSALPSLLVTDVEGLPAGAFARYVDITPRLEECKGRSGDEVQLQLTFEKGRIVTRVADSNADDAVTGCVRKAIEVDVQELADPSGQRLPDMRSLIKIRFGP